MQGLYAILSREAVGNNQHAISTSYRILSLNPKPHVHGRYGPQALPGRRKYRRQHAPGSQRQPRASGSQCRETHTAPGIIKAELVKKGLYTSTCPITSSRRPGTGALRINNGTYPSPDTSFDPVGSDLKEWRQDAKASWSPTMATMVRGQSGLERR